MGKAPARPARFLKTQYLIAAIVPALVVVFAITGFVWAQKGVTVVVDGESRYVKTQAEDVSGLLDETDVDVAEGDVVSPAPEAPLSDGMTVVVCHAIPVVLEFSGERIELDVIGSTVADALVAAGADPGASMVVEPSLDAPLEPGMTITANNVFVRVVEEEEEIPFETVTMRDAMMDVDTREVAVQGAPGTVLRVYKVVVTDGIEGARKLVTERVVAEQIDEVIAVGSRRSSGHVTRSSALANPAAKEPATGIKLSVSTTAYVPGVGGVGTRTATGASAGFGVIAVDPSVIPLGTRIYVPGYGYGVAADTGGAIRGNKIDLCFDALSSARAWGRRTVTITILP